MKGFLQIARKHYQNRSFAERKLVELVEKCWEFDPNKRIDIFEVVRFLEEAIRENEHYDSSYSK